MRARFQLFIAEESDILRTIVVPLLNFLLFTVAAIFAHQKAWRRFAHLQLFLVVPIGSHCCVHHDSLFITRTNACANLFEAFWHLLALQGFVLVYWCRGRRTRPLVARKALCSTVVSLGIHRRLLTIALLSMVGFNQQARAWVCAVALAMPALLQPMHPSLAFAKLLTTGPCSGALFLVFCETKSDSNYCIFASSASIGNLAFFLSSIPTLQGLTLPAILMLLALPLRWYM